LAEVTREFEEPFVFEKARPMTAAERGEERKLRRHRGRPNVGAGAKKVSISLEGGLLRKVVGMILGATPAQAFSH
jgi:hypothetical protein